jgi:hypothetical protein
MTDNHSGNESAAAPRLVSDGGSVKGQAAEGLSGEKGEVVNLN